MNYQMCTCCVCDTGVPGIRFDRQGVCSYCKLQEQMELWYPLNESGKNKLDLFVERIRAAGKNNAYDCAIGVSGGRDSTYTLLLAKRFGLRPLAVHFNDHFGNPVGRENMLKATKKLQVELRIVTADYQESIDIKKSFLKAHTSHIGMSTDIGIAGALYGTAVKENIKWLIIGQSFRTEGIAPLEWNYLDGRYLKSVHGRFGTVKLSPWKPEMPGFNLDVQHMFYYAVIKRIKTFTPLYYINYVRGEVDDILVRELDWVNPGAHYYDDYFLGFASYVFRKKFNIDLRRYNYSALIRSKQMSRREALDRLCQISPIEDSAVIRTCIDRLGYTPDEFEDYLSLPAKSFRDYPTNYGLIRAMRLPILLLSSLNLIPSVTYTKYFKCC